MVMRYTYAPHRALWKGTEITEFGTPHICCGAIKANLIFALQHFRYECTKVLRRFQSRIFLRCLILSLQYPLDFNSCGTQFHQTILECSKWEIEQRNVSYQRIFRIQDYSSSNSHIWPYSSLIHLTKLHKHYIKRNTM